MQRRLGGGRGERLVEDRAVVEHVQVHDGAHTELLERGRVDESGGDDLRHGVVRNRDDARVDVLRAAVQDHTRGLDRARRLAENDPRSRSLERDRCRVAVQLLQRHGRDADVRGVGGVEHPGAKDERRKRERRLRRGEVERRNGDQVPELGERRLRLAVVAEPVAERPLVERRVSGIELPQRGGRAQRARTLAPIEEGVAEQRRHEVERRREWSAVQECGRLSLAQDRDAQAGLDRYEVLDAEPREKSAIGGAAAQQDVLTVVDPVVVPLHGVRGAAEARARLEQRDVGAVVRELERG